MSGARAGGTSSDDDVPRSRSRDEPAPDELAGDELGGDPVCWLDRVCDRCGGLADGAPGARCDRCGAASR